MKAGSGCRAARQARGIVQCGRFTVLIGWLTDCVSVDTRGTTCHAVPEQARRAVRDLLLSFHHVGHGSSVWAQSDCPGVQVLELVKYCRIMSTGP